MAGGAGQAAGPNVLQFASELEFHTDTAVSGGRGERSRKETITSESAAVVWRKMASTDDGRSEVTTARLVGDHREATGTQIAAGSCQGLQTCVSRTRNLRNLEARTVRGGGRGCKKKKYSGESESRKV